MNDHPDPPPAELRPARVRLSVGGMTCQNCVRHVREALQAVEGVRSVDVELARGVATVLVKNANHTTAAKLAAVVRAAGYEAGPLNTTNPASPPDGGSAVPSWRLPMVLGLAVTAVLMTGEWILGLHHETWFRWLGFALGSLVQFYSGAGFYRGAWRQLKQGRSSMDTLVALGSTTAYAVSVVSLFSSGHGHLHFLEATTIISFISLGHWLEARVSRQAENALRELMQLAPDTALRQEADGAERRVPVAELKPNDAVILLPGDGVPTDGTVIEGDSAVDESMLTGEAMPVDKALHSRLYAGTSNLNGRLVMLVTGTGERTALARVIEAVKRAQASRAHIQRLADRVSSVFVPVVLLIALATGLWWGFAPHDARTTHEFLAGWLWTPPLPESVWVAALLNLAAVLIVACPCAMGLATPAAIMVAANSASRRGILIRDGVALEKAGAIDSIVFDKTGTLTRGQARLLRFESYCDAADRPPLDDLRVAVSLARISNHPVSRAVAVYGGEPYTLREVREVRGRGVEGWIDLAKPGGKSHHLRLGSIRWLQELGVNLERANDFVRDWRSKGATVLAVTADESLLGVLAVRDELKPGAAEVVAALRQSGLRVHLVTGDHPVAAAAIAAEAGIEPGNVRAETGPEQKPEYVAQLQRAGHRVAFIGDGINDAPALERADLGIAVSMAADISRKAADLVLLRAELAAIPEALGLARVTLRRIRQNLFWAFFYNATAVPLAALGFLSPILCALLMGLSDLVVIGNSLRIYWWRLRRRESWLTTLRESIDGPAGQ